MDAARGEDTELQPPEHSSHGKFSVVIRRRRVPALGERRLVVHYLLEYVTGRFKHFCMANANIIIVLLYCAHAQIR